MSMRSIKSKLQYSRFPVKLGLPPAPPWRRRSPAPGPGSGTRQRHSEKLEVVDKRAVEQNSVKGDGPGN